MAPRLKIVLNEGMRFGRLAVLAEIRLPNTPGRIRHGFRDGPRGVRCRCDCGNETTVTAVALVSGNSRSCGCLRAEIAVARLPSMAETNVTHGLTRVGVKHPLYDTWRMMMSRCYDARHIYYHRYGGRGIAVCEQWHDPAIFIPDIEHLIGPRPPGKTLDREDNDGDYVPGNVRWATWLQQRHNRSAPAGPPRKLPPDLIAEATRRRQAGTVLRVLAEDYGVSIATMHRYVTGKR